MLLYLNNPRNFDERIPLNPYNTVVTQPLLILPPRRWILRRLGRVLIFLFVAAFFSFSVFVYLGIPLFGIAFWFLYELSHVWRAYRYSKLVLWIIAFGSLAVFFAVGTALRLGFYNLFTRYF